MKTILPLAVSALVLLSAAFATPAGAEEVQMNDTLKTIFARKSVRTYTDDPVPLDKLKLLVRAGMAAPTAVDKRPWDFIIVTNKATLKKLSDALPHAKMTEHAAAAIVVTGDLNRQFGGKEALYWTLDCSAATENILLAAESLGLGAVWTAAYPDAARIQAVRSVLSIPADNVPLCVIPVGVPGGNEQPKDKFDAKQIHINKW
jgi:nitroreductase